MKIAAKNQFAFLHSLSRSQFFYLAMILALTLLLQIPLLNRGLGEDELDTVFYAVNTHSVWQTISSSVSFNNHIGYSLAARLSESLFGRSEWAFRLPALLFGSASLYFFWLFSEELLGSRLAAIGTILFAFSPAHMIWSISARGYSGMILFTLLSSYIYLRLLRHPTRRDAFFFILASVLGIYFHLYSVFVTVVQILFLFSLILPQQVGRRPDWNMIWRSFRVLWISFMSIAALSLLCYAPVLRNLLSDVRTRGRSDFDPTFPWRVIELLSGSEWMLLAVVIFMVYICGLLSLLKSSRQEMRYFILLLIVPVVIMWVARPYDLYPRFFSYYLPYYLVFFVAGLQTLWYSVRSSHFRLGSYSSSIAAVLIAVTALYSWLVSWPTWVLDEGYRDVSRAVVIDAAESAAFCAIGGDAEVFQFYFDRPIVVPRSMADFLKLSSTYPEVRCVYYQASWESPEHTEIAQFLYEHSYWSRIKQMTLFIYRR